jgi:hypothetical protein
MNAQFYKGRDNSVTLTLTNNGVPVAPASITKLEFKFDGGAIDSVADPAVFAFGPTSIRLNFGDSDLPEGTYQMMMIVYSADYPDGVVWAEQLWFLIKHG